MRMPLVLVMRREAIRRWSRRVVEHCEAEEAEATRRRRAWNEMQSRKIPRERLLGRCVG